MQPASPSLNKARLLCVDDDPRLLALLTAVLESAGFSVAGTTDPRKGLNLATRERFDLVIVDYDMPHMNGIALSRELKLQHNDLPIILFSGNQFLPADDLIAVDHHVVKGDNLQSLLQTLKNRQWHLQGLSRE